MVRHDDDDDDDDDFPFKDLVIDRNTLTEFEGLYF